MPCCRSVETDASVTFVVQLFFAVITYFTSLPGPTEDGALTVKEKQEESEDVCDWADAELWVAAEEAEIEAADDTDDAALETGPHNPQTPGLPLCVVQLLILEQDTSDPGAHAAVVVWSH